MLRNKFYDSLKRILFAFFAMMFVAPAFSATLPAGYTQLEYLESDGSQYIDTGLALQTATDDIELIYQANENTSGNSLFGARNSTTGRVYTFAITGALKYRVGWNSSSPTLELDADTNKHTLKIEHNGGVFKLDGTTIATQGNAEIITPTTATLFAIHATTSTGIYNGYVKIYEYKMWRNGTLTQHMIPVKYVSGNTTTYGMYDLMDSNSATAFHTNKGTGTFTAGPMACPGGEVLDTRHESGLPVGYTLLDYIQSSGTQYIDTGFSPDANTSVDWKGQLISGSSGVLLGARVGNSNPGRFFPLAFAATTGTSYRTTYGDNDVNVSAGTSTVCTGSFRPSESKSIINGTTYSFVSPKFSKTESNNLLLFGVSGYGDQHYLSTSKIWYVKIWDNNTLVRDFVPAKRNSDNEIGMYDLVSGQFFTNQGTGDFAAGNTVSDPIVEQCVAGGAIKIATTKYNEDAFADLVTTLNSAITKVTNIVDTTVAQASSIGTLATTKQDRPADGDCPAGRKCLLVTGTDGKPHWYLIQE